MRNREDLWDIMVSGIRVYDLAEPLGFSPIDINSRMHACRMRTLEFELDDSKL